MSFKTIQIMLEISDGLIKEKISVKDYLQFLLFFPTVSSGPIDRSRRFLKEINEVLPRKDYLELAGDGIYRIVLGLLYKVVLSTYVYQILLALSNILVQLSTQSNICTCILSICSLTLRGIV